MLRLMDIGDSLVRARRAAGLSQRELADKLGTTQQQVARWEASAYRSVSLGRVAAVAAALEEGTSAKSSAEEPAPIWSSIVETDDEPVDIPPVRDLGEIAARIRAHADDLRERFHIDRIGVFGAFACGRQTPGCDVSLLVETVDPNGARFIEAADFIEDLLGRPVDVSRLHLLEERQKVRILDEAVWVWPA